jgi:formylglycine-generating enzyme required for sulfatase activity
MQSDFSGLSTSRNPKMKSPNILLSIVAAVTMTFGLSTSSVQGQGSCDGADTNGDGLVNGTDLAVVLGAWGVCSGTIISVTPLQGSILGGTQITINGTNLSGTTAVKIGDVNCTSLQVLSPTLVKAVTPAGTAGEVPISVITAAGTLFSPTPFTYVQLSIASVSPNQGIVSGGTAITITGSFLNGATSVKVGGVPATNVVAVDSTTVTAVTPAGPVGPASVEVTGAKGTATASGAFTYMAIVVPAWATLLEAVPDPAVVTDADLRDAIVASGFAWRIKDTSSNIEMVLVPEGTFTMGCSSSTHFLCTDTINENPTHQVTLTQAFYMGRYEVTQAQWLAVMGSNPSDFCGYSDSPLRPVEKVSWNMIASSVSTSFMSRTGLRLPTEAEWEYAYRARTTTAFHSYVSPTEGQPNGFNDSDLLPNIAWTANNSKSQTHAVGGKLANGLGLHDMSGNVSEWCQDWPAAYSSASVTNPTGSTTGQYGVLRGGSWYDYLGNYRASLRLIEEHVGNSNDFGFRVVRTPGPTTITSITPPSGSTAGGTTITITGTNLTGATSVTVGGVAAGNVVAVSWTSVTAVTPAGTVGAKSVAVTTPNGTATATNAFTYVIVPTWATLLETAPDPTVVTDANLRAAIVASGFAWRIKDTSSNIEMLLVPEGTFTMGCSPGDADCGTSTNDSPTHQVTLTNAFYMGRYEVTQAQWTATIGSNPSFFVPQNGYSSDTTKPVEQVSWNMIASGSTSFMSLTGLRLPTEAEWEYAYRAETPTAFHSFPSQPNGFNNGVLLDNIAWYSGNNGLSGSSTYGTKAVGGKFANALGLHDMSGNVWEWCQDWYGLYSSGSVTNPTGPATGTNRLLRGGSWDGFTSYCRGSQRFDNLPSFSLRNFGFRAVRTP